MKKKNKEASEGRRMKIKRLGYFFSLSSHVRRKEAKFSTVWLGFCYYRIKLGRSAERRLEKGSLDHPQALEEKESQAKV